MPFGQLGHGKTSRGTNIEGARENENWVHGPVDPANLNGFADRVCISHFLSTRISRIDHLTFVLHMNDVYRAMQDRLIVSQTT